MCAVLINMLLFKVVQIVGITFLFLCCCEAKVYTKCEFAEAMFNFGIKSHADLGTWTCIAYHESRFNTKAINYNTGDYGILQISHYFWCSDSITPGKGCHITCKSLLGDDITEDITCATHIYAVTQRLSGNGFKAWATYKYCTGDQTQWISGCNLKPEPQITII